MDEDNQKLLPLRPSRREMENMGATQEPYLRELEIVGCSGCMCQLSALSTGTHYKISSRRILAEGIGPLGPQTCGGWLKVGSRCMLTT